MREGTSGANVFDEAVCFRVELFVEVVLAVEQQETRRQVISESTKEMCERVRECVSRKKSETYPRAMSSFVTMSRSSPHSCKYMHSGLLHGMPRRKYEQYFVVPNDALCHRERNGWSIPTSMKTPLGRRVSGRAGGGNLPYNAVLEPAAVDGLDAHTCILSIGERDVGAHAGPVGRGGVVEVVLVDDDLDDLSVLAKEIEFAQYLQCHRDETETVRRVMRE